MCQQRGGGRTISLRLCSAVRSRAEGAATEAYIHLKMSRPSSAGFATDYWLWGVVGGG